MRRPGLAALLIALCWCAPVRAETGRQVILVKPAAATCLLVDELLAGVANGGPFFPSLVAEGAPRPPGVAWFRFHGGPGRLRVRGHGLSGIDASPPPASSATPPEPGLAPWDSASAAPETDRALPRAPDPPPPAAPDVDELITGQSCETITEAAVALVTSVLSPGGGERDRTRPAASADRIEHALEQARDALQPGSTLTAGVLRTDVDLALVVEDAAGFCRRGTWLNVSGPEPRFGLSVQRLERDVLECLAERRRDDARRQRESAASPSARTERRSFRLPLASGAVIAGLGLTTGFAALEFSRQPAPFWLYGSAPAMAGGMLGYLLPPRAREATWLGGYWLGVAGASLVAGINGGGSRPVLVGGLITAGAASSAGLAWIDGLRGADADPLPAWAVATPATLGGALGLAALLVKGRGSHSTELAALGGAAAALPVLWLTLRSPETPLDRGPVLAARVSDERALLLLVGEL